jgi:SLBB-domain like (DUF1017).
MKMQFKLLIGSLLLATAAHADAQSRVTLYGSETGQPVSIEGLQDLAQLVTSPQVNSKTWWPGAVIATAPATQKAKTQQQRVLNQLTLWQQQAKAPLAATLRSVREQLAGMTVVGRQFVELDPDVVRTQAHANVRLQGEYQLYLTPRPNTVTLLGAIAMPGEQRWQPGTSVGDYFKEQTFLAGAETSSVTVISPNGKHYVAPIALWNARHREAEPGSLIWVGLAADERGLNEQIIRLLTQREAK